jgi:hypothetical protein
MATGLRSITRMSRPITGGVPMQQDIQAAEKVFEPQRQRGQEFLAKSKELGEKATEGAVGLEQAKMQREAGMRQAGAKAESEYAEAAKGLTEGAEKEIEKFPFPQFKPTQEDATTYSQLASLVATLGMMLGGGAKASSKAAIASMTGMMQGWQAGRRDLWERESKAFEKEVQRIKSQHEAIYKNLKTGLEQASRNKEASRQSLEAAAFLSGSNSILASMLRNGQTQNAMNLLQSQYKMLADLDEKTLNLAQSERNRRAQEEMQRRNEQLMRESIQATKDAVVAKSQQKEKPKDDRPKATAVDSREYRALERQERGWDRIEKLMANKEFADKFDNLGYKKFFLEPIAGDGVTATISKGISSAIAKSIAENDSQMTAFLQDILITRNAYYLAQSGKAVTGGEAARNFFATLQPTDSAIILFQKAKRAKEEIAQEKTDMQKAYRGLPEQPSQLQKKYKIDEIIDRGGKKYRVIGINDPSNPDVEEVK